MRVCNQYKPKYPHVDLSTDPASGFPEEAIRQITARSLDEYDLRSCLLLRKYSVSREFR